jgi:hypothetical protein
MVQFPPCHPEGRKQYKTAYLREISSVIPRCEKESAAPTHGSGSALPGAFSPVFVVGRTEENLSGKGSTSLERLVGREQTTWRRSPFPALSPSAASTIQTAPVVPTTSNVQVLRYARDARHISERDRQARPVRVLPQRIASCIWRGP